MKNVAVYNNKGKDHITIFTFSEEAYKAVMGILYKEKTRFSMCGGAKEGSVKIQANIKKDQFNEMLQSR